MAGPKWCLPQLLWALTLTRADARECPIEQNIMSTTGGKPSTITFENRLGHDIHLFWLDFQQHEIASGVIGAFSDITTNSFGGHAFRIRTGSGALLKEHIVSKSHAARYPIIVEPCGKYTTDDFPLWDAGRDEEFEALVHDHRTPCDPAGSSKLWSCVRYLSHSMLAARNRSLYGFQSGEVSQSRLYDTFDKTYTSQIAKIPKITPAGAGYLHMTMTQKLKDIAMEWYQMRRNDSLIPHGVIGGGYTNNHVVNFDKVDLDRFRAVHSAIIREMQQVLQWWTKLRLRHTSTFGVRVYRRDSMLINHVDRMDTHLASAVLQIHQEVDEDGGWPLEVLLPNGRAAEVYLQPGEMVLYEGAWLRHGRPMRFKGTEFANVFSHFAPLDWRGPNGQYDPPSAKKDGTVGSPNYYGFAKGRCTTWADEDGHSHCTVPSNSPYSALEVDLNFGNANLPEEEEEDKVEAPKPTKQRGWFGSNAADL